MEQIIHFDSISDAWYDLFGNNFHFGYFETTNVPLQEATNKLIEKLTELSNINKDTFILDVGCGIGETAFYLYEKFQCKIAGITINRKEIKIAKQKYEEYSDIQFYLSDALNNSFPSKSFHVIIAIESAVYTTNKNLYFKENYRVLKNDGSILLSDIVLLKELSLADIFFKYCDEMKILENTWGKMKMEFLKLYKDKMYEKGFQEIVVYNITNKVYPTFDKWRKIVLANKDNLKKVIHTTRLDTFLTSCNIMEKFFNEGLYGYVILKAKKKI